jgi:hypothetical protein
MLDMAGERVFVQYLHRQECVRDSNGERFYADMELKMVGTIASDTKHYYRFASGKRVYKQRITRLAIELHSCWTSIPAVEFDLFPCVEALRDCPVYCRALLGGYTLEDACRDFPKSLILPGEPCVTALYTLRVYHSREDAEADNAAEMTAITVLEPEIPF